VSLFGLILLVVGQLTARKPVIQLRILFERAFCGVFVLSLAAGAALYGLLYLIPQFLADVAGYNAEQAGMVAFINGVPTIAMLFFFPILVRRIDVRVAIASGLVLYGISCLINAGLTGQTAGPEFFWPQVIRGFGQFFSLLFLNQAATSAVAHDLAEDASGLFNAARNLGGSIGLAAIGVLQDQRTSLHAARLAESISANSVIGQAAVATQGVVRISHRIQAQAAVMAYADLFWVFGVALFAMIPLVLLLKPLPKHGGHSHAA